MRWPGGTGVARAVASALVVVALSLAFHLFGGGHAPGLRTVLGLTVLVAVAALPLTRTRVGVPGLLALLAVAQVALHAGFEAGTGHGAHSAPVPMVVTHAVATVLTALVLLRGRALVRRAWVPRSRVHLLLAHVPVRRSRHILLPALRTVPAPSPGVDAVMGRAPPRLVAHR